MERQVLLFHNEQGQVKYEKQKRILVDEAAGMKERDILVRSYSTAAEHEAVFKKWSVDQSKDFTFILVGRDGGEKHRSHECVTTHQLFGLIDAMPMRKNEQKQMKKKL